MIVIATDGISGKKGSGISNRIASTIATAPMKRRIAGATSTGKRGRKSFSTLFKAGARKATMPRARGRATPNRARKPGSFGLSTPSLKQMDLQLKAFDLQLAEMRIAETQVKTASQPFAVEIR